MPSLVLTAAALLIGLGITLIWLGRPPRSTLPPLPPAAEDSFGLFEETNPLSDGADRAVGPNEASSAADVLAPPLVVVQTRPYTPLVTSEERSTPADHRRLREEIGSRLDLDLTEVRRLTEGRPPQLPGVTTDAPTAVISMELAVLRAYLRGSLSGLDTRLREGTFREVDRAATVCLVSALSRLPVHRGVVFHRTQGGGIRLDAFFPGAVLVEPAFTRAQRHAFPAGDLGAGPLVRYVIWSGSGRLAALLVGHDNTVMFTPGTRFRVLGCERRKDVTVFLAEEEGHWGPQVLEHLKAQAAQAGTGPMDGPPPSPVLHPGLDETGKPFAPRTQDSGPPKP